MVEFCGQVVNSALLVKLVVMCGNNWLNEPFRNSFGIIVRLGKEILKSINLGKFVSIL